MRPPVGKQRSASVERCPRNSCLLPNVTPLPERLERIRSIAVHACATVLLSILLPACLPSILPYEPTEFVPRSTVGPRPIYVDAAGAREISYGGVRRAFGSGARFGSLRRIGIDTLSGILLYGIRNGRIGYDSARFFRVPGVTFLEVIDSTKVRVSNFTDELELHFESIDSVTVVSRTPDRYAEPEIYARGVGAFECYDPALGAFGGWVTDTLEAPKCLGRW